MKEITLKVYVEEVETGGGTVPQVLTSYELLRACLNAPGKGIQVDEMMQRIKILGILDQCKAKFTKPKAELSNDFLETEETIFFEDADFALLKTLYRAMEWAFNSAAVVDVYKQLA